ncbi:MAG: hypothetical protein CM1200mP14_06040 [Gammaproteobacteria bacterium]|nr:MAG: hypothetical protein CM1200mP14_06040 [Gammaproteobacteria bacterium]
MNSKVFLPVYVLVILVVTASCAGTPSVPVGTTGTQIIQPGAPGEMAQAFDTAELEAIGGLSHSEADVRFMRGDDTPPWTSSRHDCPGTHTSDHERIPQYGSPDADFTER